MRSIRLIALASVSFLPLAAPVTAQTTPSANATTATAPGDIIVTARRRDERLQDVPKKVDAISADLLRNNNIQKFEDVASIVPGVNLQNSGNGLVQTASMRGATFDVDSALPAPTVQFYLNDANIGPNTVFQSMYDVGQIEFLRGPQGTLRGQSAPSGAITVTTKIPDLSKFGGFTEASADTAVDGSDLGGVKGTAALNLPIIAEKLAVRVAGTVDSNNANGVKSAYPNLYSNTPYNRTWSERVSVRAMPIETLDINLMYERLVNREQEFLQTESICLIDPAVACNAQPGGSALVTPRDQLSTVNGFRSVYQMENIWNARADWHILGQTVSYVGLYEVQVLNDVEPEDGANWYNTPGEGLSATAPFPPYAPIGGTQNPYQKSAYARSQNQSHEIRISNETRILGMFDYVVGFNTVDNATDVKVSAGGYYPQAYLSNNYDVGRNESVETAFFGNLTAHPTSQLEISGGVRSLVDRGFETPAGGGKTLISRATHTIWAASASYHFTPDVMGYVSAGSSFRPGGSNLGLAYAPAGYGAAPLGTSYANVAFIGPESSTSYEAGIKAQLLDRRLTLNLDYYHQDFNGYQYISPDYIETSGAVASPPGYKIIPPIALGTLNVPAKVDGVEGDINYAFSPDAHLGASFSYADGRITGGAQVPCFGDPTQLNASHQVNFCTGGPLSNAPRLSGSVHADYARPVSSNMVGFVRGQMSAYGASPDNPAGVAYDKTKAYALFNFYGGVRSPDSRWEVLLFVKNAFNNQTRLQAYGGNINASTGEAAFLPFPAPQTALPVNSNYAYITTPTPRTVGINIRYAFGSR